MARATTLSWILGTTTVVAAATLLSLVTTRTAALAQVEVGGYWLFQPHQSAPVGRAWSNADRTNEYWAYIVGEYRFADEQSTGSAHWKLEASYASPQSYGSLAEFKSAVLALPEMSGKTILFQAHLVSEETVEN